MTRDELENNTLGALLLCGVTGIVVGVAAVAADGAHWWPYIAAGAACLALVLLGTLGQAVRTYRVQRRLLHADNGATAQEFLRNLAYTLDTRARRTSAGRERDELRVQTDLLLAAAEVAEASNAGADRHVTDAKLRALYVVVLEWAQIAGMR